MARSGSCRAKVPRFHKRGPVQHPQQSISEEGRKGPPHGSSTATPCIPLSSWRRLEKVVPTSTLVGGGGVRSRDPLIPTERFDNPKRRAMVPKEKAPPRAAGQGLLKFASECGLDALRQPSPAGASGPTVSRRLRPSHRAGQAHRGYSKKLPSSASSCGAKPQEGNTAATHLAKLRWPDTEPV
jgi:hypothetical protein